MSILCPHLPDTSLCLFALGRASNRSFDISRRSLHNSRKRHCHDSIRDYAQRIHKPRVVQYPGLTRHKDVCIHVDRGCDCGSGLVDSDVALLLLRQSTRCADWTQVGKQKGVENDKYAGRE